MDERPVINIAISESHEIKIPITNGDTVLTTLIFNPNDMEMLSNYYNVYDLTHEGSRRQKELEIDIGNLENEFGDDILDRDLSSVEDFDMASKVIHKHAEQFVANIQTFDKVVKGLDAVFGEGICDLFLTASSGRKYRDITMLYPLIDGTKPFFDEATKERQGKVDAYKEKLKNRAQRRLENK